MEFCGIEGTQAPLRGNFNCDFLGEIGEGAAEKMKQCSGGVMLGITLLQQKECSAAAETMYSAVVRVCFNR